MQKISTNKLVQYVESKLDLLKLHGVPKDKVIRILTTDVLIHDNGAKSKGYIDAEAKEKDGFGI